MVLFVIDLKTRRVYIPGITNQANGEWMAQIARNLSDAVAGPLRGFGYLIVDRDPLYTEPFKRLLAAADVHLLRLPAHSPNLNAYAERFVRSLPTGQVGPRSAGQETLVEEQPRREPARPRFPPDACFVLVDAQVVGGRELEDPPLNQEPLPAGPYDLACVVEGQMGESVSRGERVGRRVGRGRAHDEWANELVAPLAETRTSR
jgi:hypothetical protein